MRYEIKNGQVVESMFIDAPYDTKQDAQDGISKGIVNYTLTMEKPEWCYEGKAIHHNGQSGATIYQSGDKYWFHGYKWEYRETAQEAIAAEARIDPRAGWN